MRLVSIITLSGVLLFANSCEQPEEEKKNKTQVNVDLDSLIQANPDSIPLLLERGNQLFKKYDYNSALGDAAKAFRLDSNNLEAQLLYAEVINNREQRTVEEVAIAQGHYKHVIKLQPKNLRALVGLASTYSFQQDFEKSFQYHWQQKYYWGCYIFYVGYPPVG
ncbi:MAG: hypothetical protein JKY09_02765 [Crocinitomicaceae bacterium]|nr:hypothetical protein [Crocinitomicaceae bacterium]